MQKILNFKESIILICFISLMSSWFILPDWSLNIVCLACCNGLVVLGLLVLMRAGLISFGHGLYYCLGGYTVAIAYNFLNVKDAFFFFINCNYIWRSSIILAWIFCRKFRGIFLL